MAVTGILSATKAQIKLDGGIVNGKEVVVNKTFSNVKTTASDEGLYAATGVLGSLQAKPVLGIHRINEYELIDA